MSKTLFILGRQPEFGIAEIESLFPDEKINLLTQKIISLEKTVDPILINRLGGTVKIAEEIQIPEIEQSRTLIDLINEYALSQIIELPEGKINFGISYFGHNQKPKDIERLAIQVKKIVRKNARSIRIVPNKELELSSAQVFHNKLTRKAGFELIIIENDSKFTLARSTAVQNIDSYSSRDQERPYRDAKVGMLPPKLAQMMVNFLNPAPSSVILDPFCGTGVILQEALLMDLCAVGTDIDKRMVEYSTQNIEWLRKKYPELRESKIELGDATSFKWSEKIDFVVTEAYLGRPFFQIPGIGLIEKEKTFVNDILTKFLENIYNQISAGTKLCIAVPAWRFNNGFVHLPILDQLEEIGYNPMSFKNIGTDDLVYFRPNQAVARQIILLIRK